MPGQWIGWPPDRVEAVIDHRRMVLVDHGRPFAGHPVACDAGDGCGRHVAPRNAAPLAAARLVRHLTRAGSVAMRRPAVPTAAQHA